MTEVKQVTIETPKQQHTTPEKNRLGFERTFHRFGIVTDKTKIPDKSKSNQIRPLQERARRAEIYKELRSLRKQEQTDTTPDIEALKERKRTLFDEARVRDEVAKQYLTQGEVKVDLPGLGVQTGRYVEISPPESLRTPDTDEKPTIFLIPGIANDIDAVGALAQEFAMFGRKVVVVAFPESIMGNVTPEYAEAVSKSPGYEPQIEFYKKAYLAFRDRHVNNSGIGSGDRQPEMELWGFSTGAPVAAGMLEDPELQEMTTGAVLLNPASSKDMSARELMVGGTIAEIRELKAKKQLLPRYTFTAGRKKGIEQDDKDQKKLKKKIFKSLLTKVRTEMDTWKKARVREGGNILVMTSGGDKYTGSSEVFKTDDESLSSLKQSNPQIDVLSVPNASHITVLIEPSQALEQIFDMQSKSAI